VNARRRADTRGSTKSRVERALQRVIGMRSLVAVACLSVFLSAACGARLEPASSTGCPPPNPGLCAPSITCENGSRRTGQASCVDGAWVCAEESCGDAGACDGTTYPTCIGGRITTACCPSNGFCLQNDYCDLGGGACSPGICGADAGACDGGLIPYCNASGRIDAVCCPAGAHCSPTSTFCDHGDGTCTPGECPFDAGSADACASLSASSYDRSCATNDDCVSVYEGSLCSDCLCPNAAIARSAQPTYESDRASLGGGPSVCFCPAIASPVCRAGVCRAQ
jgi:hypothetical protein